MRNRVILFAAIGFAAIVGLSQSVALAENISQLRRKAQPAPVVVVATSAEPAQGLFDGSLRKAILKGIVKRGVERKLTSEGFKSVGGDAKPLSDAEFEKLWSKYEELNKDGKLFDQAVKESSPKAFAAVGEGGFLAGLLEWIRTHPEEIKMIIQFIMTLLALL